MRVLLCIFVVIRLEMADVNNLLNNYWCLVKCLTPTPPKLCRELNPFPLKDCAKIYVASLVCIPPDGKAQAKRVFLCVFSHIRHSDSAWSLRNLRFLREKKQEVYASNT